MEGSMRRLEVYPVEVAEEKKVNGDIWKWNDW